MEIWRMAGADPEPPPSLPYLSCYRTSPSLFCIHGMNLVRATPEVAARLTWEMRKKKVDTLDPEESLPGRFSDLSSSRCLTYVHTDVSRHSVSDETRRRRRSKPLASRLAMIAPTPISGSSIIVEGGQEGP